MSQRAWPLLLLVALTLFGGSAFAQAGVEPARRVLLVEHGSDPFLERVGAEVAGLGFVLVRSDAPGSLEVAAREKDAVAAIRVLPSRKGVEVWMSDATSGRSLLRQVIVDESAQGPNQGLVALQTAELLRTSLLADHPQPSEPVSAPAKALPPTAPEPARSAALPPIDAGVQAALGMLYSPGGGNAALQAGLSLNRSISARWGFALDLSAPVRGASLSGIEGSTSVGTYLLGAGLVTRVQGPATPLFATAGLSAALVYITFKGDAREPLVSSSDSALTAAAYLRGDVGLEPVSWFRFGVRGILGASASRVRVQFAGNEAGSWGRTFAAAFVLAEVPWR